MCPKQDDYSQTVDTSRHEMRMDTEPPSPPMPLRCGPLLECVAPDVGAFTLWDVLHGSPGGGGGAASPRGGERVLKPCQTCLGHLHAQNSRTAPPSVAGGAEAWRHGCTCRVRLESSSVLSPRRAPGMKGRAVCGVCDRSVHMCACACAAFCCRPTAPHNTQHTMAHGAQERIFDSRRDLTVNYEGASYTRRPDPCSSSCLTECCCYQCPRYAPTHTHLNTWDVEVHR